MKNFRSSIRLSSLIGNGLPERMRSVGFAFLGLTAAAGLALVAMFAQTGFPLLSPAPLPDGPEPNSVSKAVPLTQGTATTGLAQARGAVVAPAPAGARGDSGAAPGQGRETRVDGSADPVSGNPGDSSGPGASTPAATSPAPAPAAPEVPAPTAEPTPEPVEVPVSSPETGSKQDKSTAVGPRPDKGTAKPDKTEEKPSKPDVKPAKPEAKPAKTKPSKPKPKPVGKPPKPAAAPAPETTYVPAPAPAPVDTSKEKKQREEKKGK